MKLLNVLLALCLSATVTHATAASSTTLAQSAVSPSSTGHHHGKDSHGKGNHTHPAHGEHSHGKGNHTDHGQGNHTHSALEIKCDEIYHLTELVDLGKNTTKLDKFLTKHHLNATAAGKIKEEAANATTKLDKLKSNTTLVEECKALQAKEALAHKCAVIRKLTVLVDLAKNTTKLAHLNATEAAHIKEKAANATIELNKLESNKTLVSECSKLETEKKSKGKVANHLHPIPDCHDG